MVKPLRSAFIAVVVLIEFHHYVYRVPSVWLRRCGSDVAWYKASRYRATPRGSGSDSAEAAAGELGRQHFNGLPLFHGHDVPLTLHSDN